LSLGITQRRTRPFHRSRQHSHAILQQSTVGRIVHIGFYECGVDAKAAPVRDPGTLCDINDPPMQLLNDLRAECLRNLQDGLGVRYFLRINARERAIDQIRPDLALQVVVAPVKEMLQDEHPQYDLGGRAETPTVLALRPPRFGTLRHRFNHRFVLEQRVDPPQPIGPQLVTVGQQHFEQTALALSALDHARSFESICACSVRNDDQRWQFDRKCVVSPPTWPALDDSQRLTESLLHRKVTSDGTNGAKRSMTTARAVTTTFAAFLLSQITAVAIHGFILATDYAPFYGTLLRDFSGGPGWRALLLLVAHLCLISALVWVYGRLSLDGSHAVRGLKLGLIAWFAAEAPLWL